MVGARVLKFAVMGCLATSLSATESPIVPQLQKPDYKITAKQFAILPATVDLQLGAIRTIADQELIAKLPVVFDDYALTLAPITFQLGLASITVPAQYNLYKVQSAEGGDSGSFAKGADIFCAQGFYRGSLKVKAKSDAQKRDLKARYQDYLAPCFIDSDRDLSLDAIFIVGAKNEVDRKLQRITEAPYRQLHDKPLVGNSYVKIIYNSSAVISNASLDFQLYLNGLQMRFAGFQLLEGSTLTEFPWYKSFKTEALPKLIEFAGMKLTLYSIDPLTKKARISIDSNATRTSFRLNSAESTINISFPTN